MNRHSQSTRTDTTRTAHSQRGSVVVYLALALVAFGVMAMAGSGRFGASIMGVSSPNCAAQARMMAESGVRYATAYLRAATDNATLNTRINDLNTHGPYTVGTNLSFTLSVTTIGAGPGAAQVSATGSACGGLSFLPSTSASASASGGVNVPAAAGGGGEGTGDYGLGNPTVDFGISSDLQGDPPIKIIGNSISLGRLDQGENAAAIWYKTPKSLGAGVRAYFEVQWNSSSAGDGIVFGIINAQRNTANSVGGKTSMGELMGWGGLGSSGDGIQPPKIGLEIDTWRNNSNTSYCGADSRNDKYYTSAGITDTRISDHMAFIFWGSRNFSGFFCDASYDDNVHGPISNTNVNTSDPINSYDQDNLGSGRYGYYYNPSAANWLRKGTKYYIRYELTRFPTASANNRYCYMLKAWVRDTPMPSNYGDTYNDYTVTLPDIQKVIYMSNAYNNRMNNVYFGFTEGTGGATQNVIISDLYLTFKTTAPTYTVPAGYVAGWPMYENTDSTVHDLTNNNNDGTINGTSLWLSGIASPNGSAVYFDNATNIQVPDKNSLDLSTQGTISAWFYMDNASSAGMGLVHKGDGTAAGDAYSLRFDASGYPQLIVRKDNATTVSVTSSLKPDAGRWYHVAATWVNLGNLTIYINGVQKGQVGGGLSAQDTNTSLQVGSLSPSTGYFKGVIDEVYLYSTALSAAQIATLATGAP